MREELTRVDPPRSFGYQITGITDPLAPLVGSSVDGEWLFTPGGSGTQILWQGYARRALEQLSKQLEH